MPSIDHPAPAVETNHPSTDDAQPMMTIRVRELTQAPRIVLLEGLLTHEECDHLVAAARDKMQPCQVADLETGKDVPHKDRTSRGTAFQREEFPLLAALEHRIAHILGIPLENGEGCQVLHYDVDQFYKPHWDYFEAHHPRSDVYLERGGQRVATLLMYLSHVEEGGDTSFPKVGLKIMPIKGNAVLFFNVDAEGQVDPLTLHGSERVLAGDKWVMTKWLRQRRFD